MLWVITGLTLSPRLWRHRAVQHPQSISGTINPNTASWWELSLLPEIGETTARLIVQFRQDSSLEDDREVGDPAFGDASDLDQIRGIGPKTVAKIAPYLRFEN